MNSENKIGFRSRVTAGDETPSVLGRLGLDESSAFQACKCGCRRPSEPEPFLTYREIATALNVPLFAVRRAAKRGDFKIYSLGNGRRRARLSEVLAAVDAAKESGK